MIALSRLLLHVFIERVLFHDANLSKIRFHSFAYIVSSKLHLCRIVRVCVPCFFIIVWPHSDCCAHRCPSRTYFNRRRPSAHLNANRVQQITVWHALEPKPWTVCCLPYVSAIQWFILFELSSIITKPFPLPWAPEEIGDDISYHLWLSGGTNVVCVITEGIIFVTPMAPIPWMLSLATSLADVSNFVWYKCPRCSNIVRRVYIVVNDASIMFRILSMTVGWCSLVVLDVERCPMIPHTKRRPRLA